METNNTEKVDEIINKLSGMKKCLICGRIKKYPKEFYTNHETCITCTGIVWPNTSLKQLFKDMFSINGN